ncbi:MAG: hypothetical protein AAB426_11525 [Myxococcota bacterium]
MKKWMKENRAGLTKDALLIVVSGFLGMFFARCDSDRATADVVLQRLELAYLEAERNGNWGTDAIGVVEAAPEGQISLKLARIHLDAIRAVLSDPDIIDQIPQRTLQVFSVYIEKAEDVQQLTNEIRVFVATHHALPPHGDADAQVKHFNKMLREYLTSFTAAALGSRLSLASVLDLDTKKTESITQARKGAEQDIDLARKGLVRALSQRPLARP